jgi:hypothetical protein
MDADKRGKPGYEKVNYTDEEVRYLNEFSNEVGKMLSLKLQLVSLELRGIGTHRVADGQYILFAVVNRPATGEMIKLEKKMVMELGKVNQEVIEPFVAQITNELLDYYFKVPEASIIV